MACVDLLYKVSNLESSQITRRSIVVRKWRVSNEIYENYLSEDLFQRY